MNIVLWVIAALLAVAFAGAGAMKLTKTKEQLHASGPTMAWTEDFSQNQIRLIGALEVLGALGLVLPAALGIVPVLSAVAALGLFLLMAGAVWAHVRRGEGAPAFAAALVLGLLSLFVAIMRFGPNSF